MFTGRCGPGYDGRPRAYVSSPFPSLREPMNPIPAFNVRSYPSFRFPRLHRVYVAEDGLYFMRMRGILGFGDVVHQTGVGTDRAFAVGYDLLRGLIIWWSGRSQGAQASRLDSLGPRELLGTHRGNLRIEPGEVDESRLFAEELPASWSLKTRRRRTLSFKIEDDLSLSTALEHLPRLLGPTLQVSAPDSGPTSQQPPGP